MRKLRLSIRVMMAGIAVFAAGLWWTMQLSAQYRSTAALHGEKWEQMRSLCLTQFGGQVAAHHKQMRAKYELAACYPWLPVAHDPPDPTNGPIITGLTTQANAATPMGMPRLRWFTKCRMMVAVVIATLIAAFVALAWTFRPAVYHPVVILVAVTVRRMMIAVVIVALVFWLTRLSRDMTEKAANHAEKAASYAESAAGFRGAFDSKRSVFLTPTPELKARVRWLEEMAGKYKYAARYPWLCVEPDPPMP